MELLKELAFSINSGQNEIKQEIRLKLNITGEKFKIFSTIKIYIITTIWVFLLSYFYEYILSYALTFCSISLFTAQFPGRSPNPLKYRSTRTSANRQAFNFNSTGVREMAVLPTSRNIYYLSSLMLFYQLCNRFTCKHFIIC